MSDQIRILSHLRSHQDEMVKLLGSSPTLTPSTDKPLLTPLPTFLPANGKTLAG